MRKIIALSAMLLLFVATSVRAQYGLIGAIDTIHSARVNSPANYGGRLENTDTQPIWINGAALHPDPLQDWSGIWWSSPFNWEPQLLDVGERREFFGWPRWPPMLVLRVDDASPGLYSAEFALLGGYDSSADFELMRLYFQLEVVEDYRFWVRLLNPVNTIRPGESATLRLQYTNDNPERHIYLNALWIGMPAGHHTNLDIFIADDAAWFIPAGATLESDTWILSLKPGGELGTYIGWGIGVLGGFYPGDVVNFQDGEWTLHVVPEPASVFVLGGGLASLLVAARRRK